jgi:K(+)-stimulated pyrophosphate-energized sodium pump
VCGGAIIYWFTGASTQAVSTGAYRAVEFIKQNIKLETSATAKASVADSNKVVEICTIYAQKGMRNIFMVVFFSTLAFACLDAYFFIGYLISMAVFGLYQAIFMANAGGAWDNAKKVVETELHAKGTELHAASVVGDTVGDPFKDTSSVALNPVIKFTTLFGVLAVGLALELHTKGYDNIKWTVSGLSLLISMFFAWRSFYGMRITSAVKTKTPTTTSSAKKDEPKKEAAKEEKPDKAADKAEAKVEKDDKAAEAKDEPKSDKDEAAVPAT